MKQWVLPLLFLSLLSLPSRSFGDTLSLTTYYPAPFGSYSMLRLTPNTDASMGACITAKYGVIYLSSDDGQIKVCNGTTWISMGAWNTNGNNVYLSSSDTNTAIKAGIGDTTPDARFHVKGIDDATNGQLKIESTEDTAKITLLNSAGAVPTGSGSIAMSQTANLEGMRFAINAQDAMFIDENSLVGIGELQDPISQLHVAADFTATGQLTVSDPSNVEARLNLATIFDDPNNYSQISARKNVGAGTNLFFRTSSNDRMVINNLGRVTIGAPPVESATAYFDVNRPAADGSYQLGKFGNFSILDEDYGPGTTTSSSICAGNNCYIANSNFMGLRMSYTNVGPTNTMTLGVPDGGAVGEVPSISLNIGTLPLLTATRDTVVTDDGANVGVGIAAPVYKLHVNGPIGGALDSANPAAVGELKVDCVTTPGSCYAVYAP